MRHGRIALEMRASRHAKPAAVTNDADDLREVYIDRDCPAERGIAVDDGGSRRVPSQAADGPLGDAATWRMVNGWFE